MSKEEKVLVIVESPNKCKTLESFLPKNYKVVASYGHISNVKDGGSYYNTGINPQKDFSANFAISDSKKGIVEKLKQAVDKSDKVYICSDPDREGEAIAWSLRKFLKLSKSKYQRVTFHEITKSAVLEALNHCRDIDENLVDASHARLKLDKIIGYRLTNEFKKFLNIKSVGRCQTAGLLLIAEREKEIQDFKSEKYSEVFLKFSVDDESFKAKYFGKKSEVKRISLEDAKKIVDECNEYSKSENYIISDIESKKRISNTKLPFTTSTFQQEASNRLNMSGKISMSYAQRLFEGIEVNGEHVGLITYMRTDSTDIAEEFLPILENFVKKNYGEHYYSMPKKAKKSDLTQDGHECLRVTNLEMTVEKLSKYISDKNLLKVYELIYRRTLASAMSSAILNETIYTISLKEHNFKMSSKELIFDGYLKVYNFKEKDSTEVLYKHTFNKNDILNKYNPVLEIVEKETLPPARFKESTFVKELESRGIGRPSTYVTIVETLTDESRGYCEIKDKFIVPTEKGLNLAKLTQEKFSELISIDFTKEMEEDLDKIASAQLSEIEFLKNFYNKMESVLKSMHTDEVACPKCGKVMKLRKNKTNGQYFYGCSGYPNCKTTMSLDEVKEVKQNE